MYVVRKELKAENDSLEERTVHELLRKLKHPNMVELLASYQYHNCYNLLFPLASTDLQTFLLAETFLDIDTIYVGIHGLADALSHIHDFSFKDKSVDLSRVGYHHDLRPKNILIKDGIFMIADFGLSKLKPDDQDSKSRLRGGHDDYLGPESFNEVDWTNQPVGRALDIWALGCVLAEIATYIERGSVRDFRIERKDTHGRDGISVTDYAFHCDGKLRRAVDTWLQKLTVDPQNAQVPQLILLVRDMLNPNSYKRTKIAAVVRSLALLALSSKISSIDVFFSKLSYNNDDRRGDFHVLLLLEQKRFAAWDSVFSAMHQDKMVEAIDEKFQHLSKMRNTFQTYADNMQSRTTTSEPSETSKILFQVCETIDWLCERLPVHEQQDMQAAWAQAVTEIADMETLAAVRAASKPDRYRSVGIKAAMTYMSLAISDSIRLGGRPMILDSGCIDVNDSSLASIHSSVGVSTSQNNSRSIGYYNTRNGRKKVLIEWKTYDHRWNTETGDALSATMEALAKFLDPHETLRQGVLKHRVLDCWGYFHDKQKWRFGFVYTVPDPNSQQSWTSASLLSLNNVIRMTSEEVEGSVRPALGDIFLLAKDMAAALYALHEVGWIHKNISSHNILVFPTTLDEAYKYVASAVLANFKDSRPEASGATLGPAEDSGLYQHPQYRAGGVKFRRSFDFFSMGIALLELGIWYPISELRKDHADDSTIFSAEEFRKKLLKTYVPMLGEKVGALYRGAVRFCLDAEDSIGSMQEDIHGRRKAQEMFRANVVEPLAHCFA